MNKKTWLYVVALGLAALGCLGVLVGGAGQIPSRDLWGLLVFVLLGMMSEGMALDCQVRSATNATSSLSYLALLACAVTFSPFWTVAAAGAVIFTSDVAIRKRRLWVACFNASQYMLSLAAATFIYESLGGGSVGSGNLNFFAFFALAASYFAFNILIVAGFFAIKGGLSYVDMLRQMIGQTGANPLYDILASPIAIFAAWLYARLYIGGIVVAIFPLLLVRYSYVYSIQLKQVNKDLMRVLIKAIETRDPYTSGHSIRVSAIAKAIAEDLKLSRKQIETVEQAALLHDIGKIEALYAAIISKPHDLTPGERAIIQTHSSKGADMLLELSAFKEDDVIKGVRFHHERYDGTGYPSRIQGKEIPIAARIIMICDSIDAMLSDRPYRSALTPDQVRRELIRCSGTQFDPEIVRVIIESGTVERARDLVALEPARAEMEQGRAILALAK